MCAVPTAPGGRHVRVGTLCYGGPTRPPGDPVCAGYAPRSYQRWCCWDSRLSSPRLRSRDFAGKKRRRDIELEAVPCRALGEVREAHRAML